jgi:pimeloyl-ACP methyl ester carboxylesterase
MTPPETRYAKSGDVHIAYQVVGNGLLDLIFVPGLVSNIELQWEMPGWADFFSGLAAFSRLILFDKRGTGLSDRDVSIANLEERMDDVRAVLDAAGSERAALLGFSEGGPMSLLFAATYPQRARALLLYGTFARSEVAVSADLFHERLALIDRLWGTGRYCLERFLPSLELDDAGRRAWARFERQSASPSAVTALQRMNREVDVRHILQAIQVPTLIMHRVGDRIERGHYLAENIPGAKFVELPGTNHVPVHEHEIIDRMVGEIEEFLTGSRSEVDVDRILATVLFTDIVDSTKRAAELGDRQWRALLDRHDAAVRMRRSADFAATRSRAWATAFSLPSTARRARCAVPRRSPPRTRPGVEHGT